MLDEPELFAIITPPATCNAPVAVLVDLVVFWIFTVPVFDTVKSPPNDIAPEIVVFPELIKPPLKVANPEIVVFPTFILFAPIPPETTNAPVVILVDVVVDGILVDDADQPFVAVSQNSVGVVIFVGVVLDGPQSNHNAFDDILKAVFVDDGDQDTL